jgi:hypothetical protein
MCGSKKGISSNQLHRTLGVTLRTAWHMSHRIRLAMDESGSGPIGGEGKSLESDETFIGYKDGGPNNREQGLGPARASIRLGPSKSHPYRRQQSVNPLNRWITLCINLQPGAETWRDFYIPVALPKK